MLLSDMAKLFGVSVAFFNEQKPVEGTEWSAPASGERRGFADVQYNLPGDTANRAETQELLRAYNGIADPARRKEALKLLKSLTPPE